MLRVKERGHIIRREEMETVGAAMQRKARKPRGMPKKRLIEAIEKDFKGVREL